MYRKGSFKRVAQCVLCGIMTAVMLIGGVGQPQKVKAAKSENLILNPDFAPGGDLSVWSAAKGGAVITAETADKPIYDDVKTYGKITGRNSNYECFCQDVTNVVKNNEVYEYTFYVMLDKEDYEGAPDGKRKVEISPFITVNGSTAYSQGVSGTVSQVLEPGVWTKFSGTFAPTWDGKAEQVAIRILEQGMDYGQGEGVMGTYYVTGVQLKTPSLDLLIDEDAVNFCDELTKQMGDDFIAGTAICNGDLNDFNEMALVTKHFNGLTLGNELKPDAMFGYSNNRCPGTQTVTLNGKKLVVPNLDYSRAEKTLDYIYNWNQKNPDKQIKIRGHVLVWHSQTPEWWFHEDYDPAKPYADIDTMNRRLEWYIKTMAEHFTGTDSKYHGMFYGWDVVNEAVSDSGSKYRVDSENSSWWAVYGSQEFIINAFRYANKYMDPEVDLYYNDYNECGEGKRKGIVNLLNDVKNAEGTRIDGMGMQGHYGTGGNPSATDFEASARAFAAVVDKVMLTELDMGASDFYDGTDKTRAAEFSMQAYRYKEIYDVVKKLKAEGINFAGVTFWGVVDKYSWLQTSSNVGGGTDGTRKQCPLLFDDDYQIKPAFWAFADQSKLTPVVSSIDLKEIGSNRSMNDAAEMNFSSNGVGANFQAAWGKGYLMFKVMVNDTTEDDNDCLVVYVSVDGKTIQKKEIKRSEAIDRFLKGYEYTIKFELDEAATQIGNELYFDIAVRSGDDTAAFSDKTMSQETSTQYYTKAALVENPDNPREEEKPSAATEPETENTQSLAPAEDEAGTDHVKEGGILIPVVIGVTAVAAVAALLFVGARVYVKKNKKKNN